MAMARRGFDVLQHLKAIDPGQTQVEQDYIRIGVAKIIGVFALAVKIGYRLLSIFYVTKDVFDQIGLKEAAEQLSVIGVVLHQ
jgi:hypothetical protein